MRFDFNGQDEIAIGYQNNLPIKLRANGKGVYKNDNGSLSVNIDDERLKGVNLADNYLPKQAPQAPKWDEGKPQQDKPWYDDVMDFVKGGAKELGKTANAMWDASPFGDGITRKEQEQSKVAKALNQNGLVASLMDTKGNDEKRQLALDTLAPRLGYDQILFDNGKVYGGKLRNDGEYDIMDLTPNFGATLRAYKGEILGGVGGALASGGLSLPASFVASALGSGVGAYSDAIAKDQVTGQDSNRLERGLQAVGDDLVGGVAISAIAKATPFAKPTLDLGGKALSKALDLSPIIGNLRTQNIGGALNELARQVGGKEQLKALMDSAGEMGIKVAVNDGSHLASVAKDGLNKADEVVSGFAPTNSLMDKGKTLAQGAINKAKEGADYLQNSFLNTEKITSGQEDILTASRANERVAQAVGESVRQNPQVASRLNEIITKDAEKITDELTALRGNGANSKDIVLGYQKQVGDEFSEGLKELEKAYSGVKTQIQNTEQGVQFLDEIDALKNSVWGGLPNSRLHNIIDKLQNGKEIDILGVNALRAELNRLIAGSDTNVAYIAKNAKNYIEGQVLDDILATAPFKDEARALYSKMVSEYRAMKDISESKWFKKATNRDVGEGSVNDSISKVLGENATNNSVDDFLGRISPAGAKDIELNLISRAIDEHTMQMANNGKVIDLKKVAEALNSHNFRSEEAKGFIKLINDLEKVIGQDIKLADDIGAFKPGQKLGQGIAKDAKSRFETMAANARVKTITRFLPIIGRQPALRHHFEQALLKAKDYDGFLSNLESIARANPNLPSALRSQIDEFIKASRGENPNETPPNGGGKIKDNSHYNSIDEVPQAVQQEWVNHLGLKSVNDEFVPKLKLEVRKAIGDKDIKLTPNSLIKIANNQREQYIPHIKDTLENPDLIIKHSGDNLFVKDIGDKNLAFVSVGKDFETHITIVSNAPKKINNLKGKVTSGNVIYHNPQTSENSVITSFYRTDGLPPTGSDTKIITQTKAKSQAKKVNFTDKLIKGGTSLGKTKGEASPEIKGDGFVMKDGSKTEPSGIRHSFNVDEWVKNLSGVISDEWVANLTRLAKKHPEMFKSEADVFRVIKQIKDNPTHFFKNTDDGVALIGKNLGEGKAGNIGVVKENGRIIHVNKTRENDFKRLSKRQTELYKKDGLVTGTPAPATTLKAVGGDLLHKPINTKIITQTKSKSQAKINFADMFKKMK